MAAAAPVVAVIQARMGSSRLPGKVLIQVQGRSLLEHLVVRLRLCAALDAICVATTSDPSDDAVAAEAQRLGVACVRGSVEDVLSRFETAAAFTNAATVVRVTGDCPLMDPAEVARVVKGFAAQALDYAANQLPGQLKLPLGYAVEVMTREALQRAHRQATAPYAREHVTPYLYEQPGRFRTAWIEPEIDAADLRVTVDTPADLAVVQAVFEGLGPQASLSIQAVVAWLRAHPQVAQLNQAVVQKSYRDNAGAWLLLRADGSAQVGLGHVMRLAGVGQAWVKRGGKALLLSAELPTALAERLRGMGLELQRRPPEIATGTAEDAAWIRQQAGQLNAQAVVVDGYGFAPAWLAELRRHLKVACVDDFGLAELDVDLVLMPNPAAQVPVGARSPVLHGPAYTPVRREFCGQGPRPAPPALTGDPVAPIRLLLLFGGSDAAGMTSRALSAALELRTELERDTHRQLQITAVLGAAVPQAHVAQVQALAANQTGVAILRDVSDMAGLLAATDAALTAAGTTCWELAAMGVPMLVVAVADNQAVVVQSVVQSGAGLALPDAACASF
jgi:spore coat polysaccharide biosynthesis protein SpsF